MIQPPHQAKMMNDDIDNYFHLKKDDYDGYITINIVSKDKTCLESIMNNVFFELGNQYRLLGLPILLNNDTIERKIFFKKIAPQ